MVTKETREKSNNTLNIPSREEFHRYKSNTLTEYDFCTDYPGCSGYQIDKVQRSIRWTLKNKRKDNNFTYTY